jgi:hypothetical protein
MATKKEISRAEIVSMYMNDTLENNDKPQSVYLFTKKNKITESEFYKHFGSIETIDKVVFVEFYNNTILLLEKDENYDQYDMQNKLLSFYYTFFELLLANRSYVLLTLKEERNKLKSLGQLKDLREIFKNYISEIITDDYRVKIDQLQDIQDKGIQEAAWIQFLFTLKFWIEDESASFEKTDIYIEKSVKMSFEFLNLSKIDSLIDFGKFLFKEKIQAKS